MSTYEELLKEIRGTFLARGDDITKNIAERLWNRGWRKVGSTDEGATLEIV